MITFNPLDAERLAKESGIILCGGDVCQSQYVAPMKRMLPEGADPYEFVLGVLAEIKARGIRYADHVTPNNNQPFVIISILK